MSPLAIASWRKQEKGFAHPPDGLDNKTLRGALEES